MSTLYRTKNITEIQYDKIVKLSTRKINKLKRINRLKQKELNSLREAFRNSTTTDINLDNVFKYQA